MVCCSRPCFVKGEGCARINGTVSAVRTIPRTVGQVDRFKPSCGVAISIIDSSIDKTRPGRADEEESEKPENPSDGHVSLVKRMSAHFEAVGLDCTWFQRGSADKWAVREMMACGLEDDDLM